VYVGYLEETGDDYRQRGVKMQAHVGSCILIG
jgi:hypothetical protein